MVFRLVEMIRAQKSYWFLQGVDSPIAETLIPGLPIFISLNPLPVLRSLYRKRER